jgi:hypothetical protein
MTRFSSLRNKKKMDLSAADLDDLFEEDLDSETPVKLSLTAPKQPNFNLKDLDRDIFQFDEDSDTDKVKSSNCSVWSQDVEDWGDLELPRNSSLILGGNRNLQELSEMNEDDDMGLVIPDTDRPFDFTFTKSLKPANSRDLMSESEFGFESENELGSNIETLGSPEKPSGFDKKSPKKPMLITMDMMSGLLAKSVEPPKPAPNSLPERLASLSARLSKPKYQVTPLPVTPRQTPKPSSRPSSALPRPSPRPMTANSQASLQSPRATRLPDRFSSGSQRDSKRPPTHRVAFGRTLKGSHELTFRNANKAKIKKTNLNQIRCPPNPNR